MSSNGEEKSVITWKVLRKNRTLVIVIYRNQQVLMDFLFHDPLWLRYANRNAQWNAFEAEPRTIRSLFLELAKSYSDQNCVITAGVKKRNYWIAHWNRYGK